MDPSPSGAQKIEEMYGLGALVTGYAFASLLGNGPLTSFVKKLDELNKVLDGSPGPYLLEQFSLADIHLAPFLERVRASLLYAKGLDVREKPRWAAVDRWFEAMESRPCYRGTQSDFFNLVHFLPPQAGWFALENDPEEFMAAIDGTDGSWRLPLPPSRFERSLFSEVGALEAALKTVANHSRLLGFSQRGATERHDTGVDASLRIATSLLLGTPSSSLLLPGSKLGGVGEREASARACRYVRDRIGVPRDMRLGAARHFRAALNEVIEMLGFDSREKDLQTTHTSGLTYAPPGSKHVADLRFLYKQVAQDIAK